MPRMPGTGRRLPQRTQRLRAFVTDRAHPQPLTRITARQQAGRVMPNSRKAPACHRADASRAEETRAGSDGRLGAHDASGGDR
jgi:hypothetical protein